MQADSGLHRGESGGRGCRRRYVSQAISSRQLGDCLLGIQGHWERAEGKLVPEASRKEAAEELGRALGTWRASTPPQASLSPTGKGSEAPGLGCSQVKIRTQVF